MLRASARQLAFWNRELVGFARLDYQNPSISLADLPINDTLEMSMADAFKDDADKPVERVAKLRAMRNG